MWHKFCHIGQNLLQLFVLHDPCFFVAFLNQNDELCNHCLGTADAIP